MSEGILQDVNLEDTRTAVLTYLDEQIVSWRETMMEEVIDEYICRCYIDAYQSTRMALFGETLPVEGEYSEWLERRPFK